MHNINKSKHDNILKDKERYKLDLETELVWYQCDECDEWFIMDQNNLGKYLNSTFGPGKCSVCGKYVEKCYPTGICEDCHKARNRKLTEENMSRKICTVCGKLLKI